MNKEAMSSEKVMQADLDFGKLDGLLAVVIQDAMTQRVLMVGFMNAESYACTQYSDHRWLGNTNGY